MKKIFSNQKFIVLSDKELTEDRTHNKYNQHFVEPYVEPYVEKTFPRP